MAQPTFRRMWVRILPDGSAIPQFDLNTGKYCGYEHYQGPVAQILFFPISPRLAELIQANGDKAESSDLPQICFEVPPNANADMHRVGTMRLDPMRVCGLCELQFPAHIEVCPRCLAKNQWYCGKCDSLVEYPLIDNELHQVRCPICEPTDPRGVRQIHCVGDLTKVRLFTHYVLDLNGERHIILDYKINKAG